MIRPDNSVSVREGIPLLLPNALSEWDGWLTELESLDIDTIGDVCIIETRLWEGLKLPSVLKDILSLVRMTSQGSCLPLSTVAASSSSSNTSSLQIGLHLLPIVKKVASTSEPISQQEDVGSFKQESSDTILVTRETSVVTATSTTSTTESLEAFFPASDSQTVTDDAHTDDDDDDYEEVSNPKKLTVSSTRRSLRQGPIVHHAELKPARQLEAFTVMKSNQLGLGQTRVITMDEQAATLRFSDTQMKLKMEVPFAAVSVNGVESHDRKITVAFKDRNRVYDITFPDASACTRFRALHEEIASMHSRQLNSSLATSRLMSGGVTKDELEVSAHEEYKIVKKNKYKQRQHRILVLKPSTVVLLDEKRKFIKAFEYQQIHSVEIPSLDDKKGTSEAEIFLVFNPAVNQRPFQCFFTSALERTHFALCLKSYHRALVLKEGGHVDRFVITKLATNSARVQGKRRILEVLPARSVIRSYDRIMQFKDTDISRVKGIAPDPANSCRLYFTTNKKFIYDFSDHLARTHFLSLVFFMLDGITHQSPGKTVTVFCGSWVAGTCVPTKSNPWSHWLFPNKYDIYAIGLQKVHHAYVHEWPLQLQRLVGDHIPDFVNLSDKEREFQANYHTLAVHHAGEMILAVFIRKALAYKVTYVDVATCICDPEGVQRRGGTAVCLTYEDTSLCFVTSHFKGKPEKLKERRADYMKVLRGLKFKREGELLTQFDHLFWFGNMNYRLDISFTEALALTEVYAVEQLLGDQLTKEMHKKDPVFLGFQEGKITFPPSHQKGITKQVASYTDRVLWKSVHASAISLQEYSSAADVLGSLHRPVYGVFAVTPRSYKWAGYSDVGPIVELSLFDLLFKSDTVSPEAELQIVVSGPFLERDCISKISTFQQDSWSWFLTGSFRAHVQPEHLHLLHLNLTLKDVRPKQNKSGKQEDHLVYGYCVVPLAHSKSKFQLAFIKEGLVVGHVTGNVIVKASEESKV